MIVGKWQMDEFFNALLSILDRFGDNHAVRETIVFAAWRRAAGELLCDHTCPVELAETKLVVAVSSMTWQAHLEDLSGQMIFKINSVLKSARVTYIEFRIDEKLFKKSAGKDSKMDFEKIALSEITEKLAYSAMEIKDEEMRKKFLLAAGSCLNRKKRMAAQSIS